MGEILIDTSVLVYAHQPAETVKYVSAARTLEALVDSGLGRLSMQILGEFVSATTRGRRPILTVEEALHQMTALADALPVLDVTRLIVVEATQGVRQHRMSYYDAQIWATARLNQLPTVFTEEFEDGRRIEGVHFVNPLVSEFDIKRWI